LKLYKTAHYIRDFNKCVPDIQKKIKNTEKCLEQLDSGVAKFLIEARKVKSFMGIYETSIEKNPLYVSGEYCIFMKIVLENCTLVRIGTRSSYLGGGFFY
jgi:hypothetical protein